MQSVLAIMVLTWRAAFRFRLFLVIAVLLIIAVVGLPFLLKDDGTARGFTQILLTYTLSIITALLGLSTMWLACGTLSRDIEDCQMQMVVVKPVSRWQIWIGKWLGIVSLNAALLALTGTCVFALLHWRAADLPAEQRQILRTEVLVSRGSALPDSRLDQILSETDRLLSARIEANPELKANVTEARRQVFERVKAEYQVVPGGSYRWWEVDLGRSRDSLQDQPIHLRVRFNAADRSAGGTFTGIWQVGDPDTDRLWQSPAMSLAPDAFHEIELPSTVLGDDGVLTIVFLNANPTSLLFPIEDGIEVLYREGGFLMNYIRALLIILCWMALLASIGLAASSFLSFPVASLVSMSLLVLALSSGTMALVVDTGTVMETDHEGGFVVGKIVNAVAVPVFKGLLGIIHLAKDYTPVDAISTGRSIPWGVVAGAFFKIVILLGGVFALSGMFLFARREMAATQINQ
jgi:hypothetical protein